MDVLNDKCTYIVLVAVLPYRFQIDYFGVDRFYLFCRLLQQQVCRAGYKVIEVFLYGDSRKNELYLSRFIPFFEAQVCKCLCVLCKEIAYVCSFGDLSRSFVSHWNAHSDIHRYMTVNSSNGRRSTGYTIIFYCVYSFAAQDMQNVSCSLLEIAMLWSPTYIHMKIQTFLQICSLKIITSRPWDEYILIYKYIAVLCLVLTVFTVFVRSLKWCWKTKERFETCNYVKS